MKHVQLTEYFKIMFFNSGNKLPGINHISIGRISSDTVVKALLSIALDRNIYIIDS